MSASNTNTWTPQQKKIVFNGCNWKYKILWTSLSLNQRQNQTTAYLQIFKKGLREGSRDVAAQSQTPQKSAPTGIPNRSLSYTLFSINWLEDMEAALKYWYQMKTPLSWIHFLLGLFGFFPSFLIVWGVLLLSLFFFLNYLNVVKSILILSKAWHCLHKTKCKTLTSVFPPWPQRIEPTHPTPVLTTLIMFNKAAVL